MILKKNIFFRFFFPVLCLICFITIAYNIFITYNTRNIYHQTISQLTTKLLKQINDTCTNLLTQSLSIINVSDTSLYFKDLLSQPQNSQLHYFETQMTIHRFLSNYQPLFMEYGINITVSGVNGIVYTTGEHVVTSLNEILNEKWINKNNLPTESISFSFNHRGITSKTENETVILFVKRLVNANTMQHCGYIFMELNPNALNNLYSDSLDQGEYIVITDTENQIITSSCRDINFQNILLQDKIKNDNEMIKIENENYFVVKQSMSALPGNIYKFTNASFWEEQIVKTQVITICIILTFFFVISVLFFFIFKKSIKPVTDIVHKMQHTKYGTIPMNAKVKELDEIEILEYSYNCLLAEIDEYTENYIKEVDARYKAEYQMLQMQINPHFLYNTLSAIKFLVESNISPNEITQSIDELIKLLRYTIGTKDPLFTVKQELESIERYVALQNLRYQNRIELNIMLFNDNIEDCLIPKLLLQPLVENCIFHAFRSNEDILHIDIIISVLHNTLRIDIKDDGCGIEEDRLQEIKKRLSNLSYSNNIGLYNVHRRLYVLYHNINCMEIQTLKDSGTTVRIFIPISDE